MGKSTDSKRYVHRISKRLVILKSMHDNALANTLHQFFLDCPQYARLLAGAARGSRSELNVSGLSDAAKSLIVSSLLHDIKRPIFLIVPDNHVGARFQQELSNLSKFPVYFYPFSEVSPYEQVLSSPDNIAPQMEILLRLLSLNAEPFLAIVPVRACLQRVHDKVTLNENVVRLSVGSSIVPKELAAKLIDLGYSRENLVTLRGEFSIRGDIVDIYPSSGLPLRLELFDENIESIRAFNVENQRSIEERKEAVIPPRWWVILSSEAAARLPLVDRLKAATESAALALDEASQDTLRSVMESDIAALSSSNYPESAEYYAPYIHETFCTLLDYIPEDALIAFDEWDTLAVALSSYEDKLEKSLAEGISTGRLLPLPQRLHLSVAKFGENIKGKQAAYFSSLPVFPEEKENSIVKFACHPVEKFGNQMERVIERVRTWLKSGFRVLVVTEQPQRVLGLLREWDCPALYVGVSASDGTVSDIEQATPSQASAERTATPPGVIVTREGFLHGFVLDDTKLACLTDAEMFGLKRKPGTYRRPVAEKSYESFTSVTDLKLGDYVVHIKQGIGQFVGVQRITVDNQQREYLSVQYAGEDKLYVPVDQINFLSRYRGAGDSAPRLSRLGGAEWESTKRKVKRSVKQVAEDLVNLYALRAKQEGFKCLPDTPWQYEMEEAFPYEETPDQWQAIVDTKRDLESSKPMDRLICGDVGFGKTEVALRGVFKTVMSGKQAAVLVPTTILAQQHFNTLIERFAPYTVRVGLLSRFRTAKEQRELIQRLASGECDVVVGTHRMLQKDITFKDLGLLIIDEEQRFGVAHKEKLKQLRVVVDVLTMSATPIPRTLHMALTGARDMSLISTPPTNRTPIKTFVGEYKLPLVRTAVLHELERGGQIYYVHNRVETIEQVAFELTQLVPEARILIGHGQMHERELENVMLDFSNHQADILVSTTIIESGLDIPNVNTIIINEADKLGLAQLYQLRGRVGRSDSQAYAYCLFRPNKVLSDVAQNRLKAIREFTSLGSGYQIALRDMEIRGVGNILGAEQHGHMVSVGFDLYCKLLEEAVAEIKGQAVSIESDTQVDLNVTAFLPETYIADSEQRLVEYKRLADVKSERHLALILEEWKDRFGNLPFEAQQLVSVVNLRLLASKASVTAIKPDAQGIRLLVNFRLQQWLPIQARLPKHLATRTTYKPGTAGGHGPTPSVLVRSIGTNPSEQLDLLQELLSAMVANYAVKTS